MLNFAGYEQPDGSVIGDKGMVKFTKFCQRLGWGKDRKTQGRFDILPMIISGPDGVPKWKEIPEEIVMRVKIEHPE